jgi:hypothetical protein
MRHHVKAKNTNAATHIKWLQRNCMGLGRVELPTSRLSGVRSNHLSYRPLATANRLWRRVLQVSRAPQDGQSAERDDRD